VLDRLIQQGLIQVLQPLFDPEVLRACMAFVPTQRAPSRGSGARLRSEGKRWVVDLDLEKFFDRVNHDVLWRGVARKVGDERVLKLVGAILKRD